MNREDMDEFAYDKRKKDVVEYRVKKRNSTIFMCFASLFEVVETLIIIMLLFIFVIFLFKVFDIQQNPQLQQTLLPVLLSVFAFVGGMILGFIIYKKVIRWVIKKFNMEDKLLEDVLYHYRSKEEHKKKQKEDLQR